METEEFMDQLALLVNDALDGDVSMCEIVGALHLTATVFMTHHITVELKEKETLN